MLLNVQELTLRREPVTLKETFDASTAFAGLRDVKPMGPIAAELTAFSADKTVEVTGTIVCKVQMLCSRCLDPLEQELHVPFHETFKVISKDAAEHAEQDDDEDIVPIQGERLELRPYVEDELALQLPLAPVCREDCKGLCPDCGQNRNERTCGCSAEKIDPRLASLKDWFGQ